MQYGCEKNKKPFEILRPSMTSDGLVLLLPQSEALVATIQSEDPQHTKYNGFHWAFSLEIYDRVVKKLYKARMRVPSAIQKYIMDVFYTPQRKITNLEYPARKKLYEFQELAVWKASELQGRVLLGDASGMGKKYQALAIASHFKDHRPILIVCNSMRASMWQKLVREILEMDIPIVKKISKLDDGSSITDYTLVARQSNKLSQIQYGLAIIDDSHVVLNKSSYIEKCCTKMLAKMERVVLVTAVARYMSTSSWFVAFRIIFGDRFITLNSYRRRYTCFSGELTCLINRVSLIRDRSNLFGHAPCADTESSSNIVEHGRYPSNVPAVHRRVIDCNTHSCPKSSCVFIEKWSRELRARYKREAREKHKTTRAYLRYLLRKGLRVAVVVHFRSSIRALLKHMPVERCMVLDGAHRELDENLCIQFNAEDAPAILATYRALKTCSFLRVDTVCIAELHLKTAYVSRAECVSGHRIMADVHYLIGKGCVERRMWEKIEKGLADAGL